MAIKTRKQIREELGTTLTTALTGVGNPVQAVFDYFKSTFGGKSPVVVIGSSSILGEELTFTSWRATYGFDIVTFVAREDEEVAEDALDDVAQALYETLETNRGGGDANWQSLAYEAPSGVTPATIGGDPYWMEVTPVIIEVYE